MTHHEYMMQIAKTVSLNSKCRSRQIGAVLVRDKAIISTGYNGPPRGVSHCGEICPRHAEGYPSGQGLHLCPASHAEANAIAQAARAGTPVNGSALYLHAPFAPCKSCAGLLINAGIVAVYMSSVDAYDNMAMAMLKEAGIEIIKVHNPKNHHIGLGDK
jgi:dCMP deaminase